MAIVGKPPAQAGIQIHHDQVLSGRPGSEGEAPPVDGDIELPQLVIGSENDDRFAYDSFGVRIKTQPKELRGMGLRGEGDTPTVRREACVTDR
jgi:hypothetical protein